MTTSHAVKVLAVDNHESILDGVRAMVERYPADLAWYGGVLELGEIDLRRTPPDVVVLDLFLGRDDADSSYFIPTLVEWGARVLLHTSVELPVPVRRALDHGAAGLSLKNDGLEALRAAIQEVATGGFACSSTVARTLLDDPGLVASLTPREVEVIEAVDDGLTHRQIARKLDLAENTVKDHLKSIRRKNAALGREVTNAHSLTREARREGRFASPDQRPQNP